MLFLKKERDVYGIFLFLLTIYLLFQSQSVYGGDSGDLLSAAAVGSFAHPPGYPLYSLMAWVLIKIPVYTPAWRVALLSSICSAFAITFLYKILKNHFSKIIAVSVSLFTAFLYPVFLYSLVAEVFSLNTLLVILLIYLMLNFAKNKKDNYLHLSFFIFGLGISHHHTILFSLPALFYLFKKSQINILDKWKKSFAFLLLGLLPYLYLPVSKFINSSAYYWGDATALKGFWWIFTRQAYGTFQAFSRIANLPAQRFVGIIIFFRYLFLKCKFFNTIFLSLGLLSFIYTYFRNKKKASKSTLLNSFFILFLSYLFFIFYASFPVSSDMLMATVERFYILPIFFLSPFIAYGFQLIFDIIRKFSKHKRIALVFLYLLLITSPLIVFINSSYKLWILRRDFTAEKLGIDILKNLTENAVLILSSDTPFFDTQYVHYALSTREDVLLMGPNLQNQEYRQLLIRLKPSLNLDNVKESDYPFRLFIGQNYQDHSIYINQEYAIKGAKQIPEGLLLRYYPEEATPSADSVFAVSLKLIKSYQDFQDSSLAIYENLYLADVKNSYKNAYFRLIHYFLDLNEYEKAKIFVHKYDEFVTKDDFLSALFWGQIYNGKKECQKAESYFKKAKSIAPESPLPDAFLRRVYLDCYYDDKKAKDFLDACIAKDKAAEMKLDKL